VPADLAKSPHETYSTIIGVDSGGDDRLSILDEEEKSSEEEEDVMAATVEGMAIEALVSGNGLVTNSRIGTPTNFVDRVMVVNPEEVDVAPIPPLPPPTQQFTKGSFWNVPHQQFLFLPEAMLWQQLLPVQRAATQVVQ
jgi:hypothetical protein